MNLGRMPVPVKYPCTRPSLIPVCTNRKMSCMTITSPSIPCTSVIWLILRAPSGSRSRCTTRSNAEAICSRIARSGRSIPAISTIVSTRASVSRGVFECAVVSDPSWPVFMAWSMSSASPPRTSPTTIRSGRMRSALITSWRIVICPLPSTFGGRASSRTTWSCWSWSSAASSIVRMRSSFPR